MGRKKNLADNMTPAQIEAEKLFVRIGASVTTVANTVKRNESTIRRWYTIFGWKKKRSEWLMMPLEAGAQLRTALQAAIDKVAASEGSDGLRKSGDGISKAYAAIARMESNDNRNGAIIWGVEKLKKFVQHKYRQNEVSKETVEALSLLIEQFVDYWLEESARQN